MEKQNIILDPSIDATKAAEYLELCGVETICTGVVNDAVVEKLRVLCTGECRDIQEKAVNDANDMEAKIEQMYEDRINKTNEAVFYLKQSGAALTLLGKKVQSYREEAHDPDALTKKLHGQIDEALGQKLLNKDIAEKLKEDVKSSLRIDPSAPQNTVQSVIANVNKAIRQSVQAEAEESAKTEDMIWQMKKYGNTFRRELYALHYADGISKGATAIGGITTAVSKFVSGEELEIVSGCLDIVNSIAEFMPPPASVLTGTISGIFNMFVGGPPDPSTQQVIDEVKMPWRRALLSKEIFLRENLKNK